MAGRSKPFGHQRFPAKGWSIYGAQRAQPVATGGKWDALENRSNRPIRNWWQPTATVPERMVRRGSTVRVRQRASAEQLRRDGQFPMEADSELLPESSDRHPRKHA